MGLGLLMMSGAVKCKVLRARGCLVTVLVATELEVAIHDSRSNCTFLRMLQQTPLSKKT